LHRDALHWRGATFAAAKAISHYGHANAAGNAYAQCWQNLRNSAVQGLRRQLSKINWLFEGKAAWLLSQLLPKGTPVFVASSMPVRDCEYFWVPGGAQEFYFNRGANGIDGTLSSALGIAHGLKKPTVLYTGDLAMLHDQNGFLAAKELPVGASLTIVLINNDGGGIFEHLPIAKFNPPFERFFATPQGINFKKLAALHGCDYHCPATWAGFKKSLLPLPRRGVRLIELRTDRKRDAASRAKIFREISKNL
jgi:2-succinyl-5-enolpyruvyl-6-hydroxy-3-cyclohexene-1-carboxylate synthase